MADNPALVSAQKTVTQYHQAVYEYRDLIDDYLELLREAITLDKKVVAQIARLEKVGRSSDEVTELVRVAKAIQEGRRRRHQ